MSLYRRLLGPAFATMPPSLRALHDGTRSTRWQGRADVERGTSQVMRWLATLFRLPPAGPDQPLTVTFDVDGNTEIWTRTFGDHQPRAVADGKSPKDVGRVERLRETRHPRQTAYGSLEFVVTGLAKGLYLTYGPQCDCPPPSASGRSDTRQNPLLTRSRNRFRAQLDPDVRKLYGGVSGTI
jgi:Domain of unknown function (DUF4166)